MPKSEARFPSNGSVLKVTALHCHNLKGADWFSESDPYVKVKLAPTGEEFRSPTLRNAGKSPRWNWDCKMVYEGQRVLVFEVFDEDTKADDLIGYATVRIKDVKQGWRGDLQLLSGKGEVMGTINISVDWPVRFLSSALSSLFFFETG